MRITFWAFALALVLAGGMPAARADVWDVGTDNDNDSGSDNEFRDTTARRPRFNNSATQGIDPGPAELHLRHPLLVQTLLAPPLDAT